MTELSKEEIREEKKKTILKALGENMGNIGIACKIAKISRQTFYNWKEDDIDFKEKAESIVEEQKAEMDDYAEGKLFEHIRSGNITALIFYLKTRHSDYSIKSHLELSGKMVNVNINKQISEEINSLDEGTRKKIIKELEKAVAESGVVDESETDFIFGEKSDI